MLEISFLFSGFKRDIIKAGLIFYFILFSLLGCGDGGGNSSNNNSSDSNNDLITENIATRYLQEIETISLLYYHDNDSDTQFDVCMNKDASKVIYSFYSSRKLYALLYSKGQWQDPVLLGDNGNIISSQKTHQVIMNDDGQAALIHYGSRVGTDNTFAVSYFDGDDWEYTIEVPGTPVISSYNDIICDIDSNGIVYVVSAEEKYSDKKEFTVSRFDSEGLIDSQIFSSGLNEPGTNVGLIFPKALAINDLQEVMLVYYYMESSNSWPGFTALFDGDSWSVSQDWTPDFDVRWNYDPGKLKYNRDGTAYFVYGDDYMGITYLGYDSGVWRILHDGIEIMNRLPESAVTLNDSGNELMVLSAGISGTCYGNDGTEASFTIEAIGGPSVYYHSSNAYIAISGSPYSTDSPMITYYSDDSWAEAELITYKHYSL